MLGPESCLEGHVATRTPPWRPGLLTTGHQALDIRPCSLHLAGGRGLPAPAQLLITLPTSRAQAGRDIHAEKSVM